MPRYGLVHLLALEEERLEIIELEVSDDAPAVGQKVVDIALPEGSLIISVLRGGAGFVPKADTVIESGDEVLLVLDPGLEEAITAYFAPERPARRVLRAERRCRRVGYSWPRSLSGIVQLAVTPGSGPGDWGSSPCPGVQPRKPSRPGFLGTVASSVAGENGLRVSRLKRPV